MSLETINLVIDTRERSIIPFIETEVNNYTYTTKQINVGDYLICDGNKILACIERKSLSDFASSFKDGRYDNYKKMLDLRSTTGCVLYYFVEGPAFPDVARKFERIPYGNILAAMTTLMVQHGIFVVQTANELHTAKRLNDFLITYSKCLPSIKTLQAPTTEVHEVKNNVEKIEGGAAAEETKKIISPDDLLGLVEQPISTIVLNMWMKLPGISIMTAKVLIMHTSIKDLVDGTVSTETISALKTLTGRNLPVNVIKSIKAIAKGEYADKVLSAVRYVTINTAKLILSSAGDFKKLCAMSVTDMANIELTQKTRKVKLGITRAEKIISYINYKEKVN